MKADDTSAALAAAPACTLAARVVSGTAGAWVDVSDGPPTLMGPP